VGPLELTAVAKRVHRNESRVVFDACVQRYVAAGPEGEAVPQGLGKEVASFAEVAVKLAARETHVVGNGGMIFAFDVASTQNAQATALLVGLRTKPIQEQRDDTRQFVCERHSPLRILPLRGAGAGFPNERMPC
jgi:hypothetical protein